MLLLLFPAALLGFFTLVSKHYAWYVLPVTPFLAVATGIWLADLARRDAGVLSAWGAGAVLGALLWLDVGSLRTNPFAERALTFPMRTEARELLGVGPGAGIAAVAALWCALLLALRRAPQGPRVRRALGSGVVALLLAFAAVRALAPLAFLDTRLPIEDVREALTRAQREGRPLDYPIRLGQPVIQIARFHFGEDFEIVLRGGPEPGLWLYPRGDPRVLSESIGRQGLEQRLGQSRR